MVAVIDKEAVLAEMRHRLDHKARRKDSYSTFGEHLEHVGLIACADGLTMSVQASAYHYCTPRESEGPWTTVEVGFPSRRVEKLMSWIEDWGGTDPKDAVYGYVPIETVAEVIVGRFCSGSDGGRVMQGLDHIDTRPHPLGVGYHSEWDAVRDRWNARHCNAVMNASRPHVPFAHSLAGSALIGGAGFIAVTSLLLMIAGRF